MTLPTISVGTIFGDLTVSSAPFSIQKKSHGRKTKAYTCSCACGSRKDILANELAAGRHVSCGCHRHRILTTSHVTHGLSGGLGHKTNIHPDYRIWIAMRSRCRNPKHGDFAYYGGRGISVCARWDDFTAFAADMGPRPSPMHTIDRKDNDGNYEQGNCRWATRKEQANNRRPRGRGN